MYEQEGSTEVVIVYQGIKSREVDLGYKIRSGECRECWNFWDRWALSPIGQWLGSFARFFVLSPTEIESRAVLPVAGNRM